MKISWGEGTFRIAEFIKLFGVYITLEAEYWPTLLSEAGDMLTSISHHILGLEQPVDRDDIIGNLVKQDTRVWSYTLTGLNHLQSMLNK